MLKRLAAATAAILALAPAAALAAPDCAALKDQRIALTTIESAEAVAGPFQMSTKGPAGSDIPLTVERPFCRVKGLIRPAATSNIHFETWLPADWNGAYFQAGNGGLAGSIRHQPMAEALARGYAASSTDDGTSGRGDLSWQADPERQLDYQVRAVHLTAVAGQALTKAYYGKPARHAYFVGGSKGGQEAMTEVQRFPEDFDGVVAIYPVIRGAHMAASLFWLAQQMTRSPEAVLHEPQLVVLHKAALAACAGKDGGLATDGFLTWPPACRFDPVTLECKSGVSDGCLTPEQVKTAAALYAGPADPKTGQSLNMGLYRGGEAPTISIAHGWGGHDGTLIDVLALENSIGKTALGKENWRYKDFDFATDYERLTGRAGDAGSTFRSDIRAFKARGGKLILIHGWNDPIVPPANTILYFDRVVADQQSAPDRPAGRSALDETRRFVRLFMVPGFGHGVSSGLQPADPLGAISGWVETGKPPVTLAAAQYEGGDPHKTALLKRDLCAWPEQPQMAGDRTACQAGH